MLYPLPWRESRWAHVFELQNVTGHDEGRVDLDKSTVSKHDGLESEGLLELVDDGAGLVLLNETDGGVEEKQGDDDAKVDPILKTCGKKSGSLDKTTDGPGGHVPGRVSNEQDIWAKRGAKRTTEGQNRETVKNKKKQASESGERCRRSSSSSSSSSSRSSRSRTTKADSKVREGDELGERDVPP